MRWASRLAPFGAPTWTTRSTSPQSMPRSSVEVQTMARNCRFSAIAVSTRRRWLAVERAVVEGDRQGVVVDPPQLLEQQLGLAAVLTKSSVVLCAGSAA
jgi:hypothetical protein